MARDRFGIKPLHFLEDNNKVIFASEMKSLFAFGLKRKLNHTALYTYLQLNYLPSPLSMIEGVQKVRFVIQSPKE